MSRYLDMKNILVLMSVCLFSISCSKKALTELAAADDANNSQDSQSGGGGAVGNQNQANLDNRNAYFQSSPGTILAYNYDTGQFTDVSPTGSQLNLMTNEGMANSNLNLKMGVFHSSVEKPGSFMVQQNQNSEFVVHYYKYSDRSLTSLGIQVSATPNIVYSGNYAMVTSASDSVNYILSSSQATAVNTLLGLDTANEDLSSYPVFLPLGKGYFAAFSLLSGQSVTNKLITFKANAPHQIQRMTTTHPYLFMGTYTENSVFFATASDNYDMDFYFLNYTDGQLIKIHSILSNEFQLSYIFHDSQNDYYLILKDLVQSQFVVKKISGSDGSMTQVASHALAGLEMQNCQSDSFVAEKTELNSKLFLMCTANVTDQNSNPDVVSLLITIDKQSETISNQIVFSQNSEFQLFTYKGELYVQNQDEQFVVVNASSGQVGQVNDNQLFNDLISYCQAQSELAGYNCQSLVISNAKNDNYNRLPTPLLEEDVRSFFVGVPHATLTAKSYLFIANETEIESKIEIQTFGDMLFSVMRMNIRLLGIPLFPDFGN